MGKRGHGEGTVFWDERKQRWIGSVDLGYINGRRVRKPVRGKTQREAREKLRAVQRTLEQGLPVTDDRRTVAQFLTDWLGRKRATVKPATHRSYEQIARLYLLPTLGRHRLTKLTPAHVQTLLDQKSAAGLAPHSVARIRDVLRGALNQAVKWGYVAQNVAKLVDPPRIAHRELAVLNPAQAKQFLDAARGDRHEALYSVAVALGMRLGEILGLRWDDVDLDRGTLHVRQAMQRAKGEGLRRVETKSRQSRRALDLPAGLVRALRAHKRRQNAERLAAGEDWQDHGLVFCTRRGTPLDGTNVTKYFQRLLARAGLPRLRFHDLRHSCASLLAAQGIPANDVARLLGHSDVRLTLNTYTHQFDEARRRAAEAMEGLFAGDDDAVEEAGD